MSSDMIKDLALSWLRTAIGKAAIDFRDGQWEAINQLVTRRGRVLCVQRTGWGKSMVYFVIGIGRINRLGTQFQMVCRIDLVTHQPSFYPESTAF